MHISVERTEPGLNTARPHYCPARGEFVGLRFESSASFVCELFCPWCGTNVPTREPGHNYRRAIHPKSYDGPRCAHGYADVACIDLAGSDDSVRYDLDCGAIREYPAAVLARRYGCAPAVEAWVRRCPLCRQEIADRRAPLLRHELELIGRAISKDLRAAEAELYALRDDARQLHEALLELRTFQAMSKRDPERTGFVYLIGHARAVKIGWTDRHPATPGGRLADLQIGSPDELELLGLIEAPFSRERQIQNRFAEHHLRGEWFSRQEQILDYFAENGLSV